MAHAQCTKEVLMVAPVAFTRNADTLQDNHFQDAESALDRDAESEVQQRARAEFDTLVNALRAEGVEVHQLEDTTEPTTPDSIFPNNWFSTHLEGLCIYPMKAVNRRLERTKPAREFLRNRYATVWDYTDSEREGLYLEGTGSMVLDRLNRIAYACRSARTDENLFLRWCEQHSFQPLLFEAIDESGQAIYHTNVVMSVGEGFAVVCEEALGADAAEVRAQLERDGHTVISISLKQMSSFCGNCLMLKGDNGHVIAMSAAAFGAFTEEQKHILSSYGTIVSAPIPTIETLGGGSVRCMLAELF